jgi:hypothetical protein
MYLSHHDENLSVIPQPVPRPDTAPILCEVHLKNEVIPWQACPFAVEYPYFGIILGNGYPRMIADNRETT